MVFSPPAFADAPPRTVIGGTAAGLQIKPSSAQVSHTTGPDGITVTIKPGPEGYPGITFTNTDGKPFDLSKHGHLEAKVTNLGTKPLGLNLRVDNDGDWKKKPYNVENTSLKPGESGVINLIFGHSYGKRRALN